MTSRLVALSCFVLLAACTETGDSAFTYEETDTVAPDTSSGVYWEHVQPILGRTCVGCHTASGSGGSNFGNVYEDNLKPSYFCPDLMVGECLSVRLDNDTMPPGGGGGGMTVDERALLDEWVAAGMPFAAGGGPLPDPDVGPEDIAEDIEQEVIEDVGPVDVLEDADTANDTATDTATDSDAADVQGGDADALLVSDDGGAPAPPTYTENVQPILDLWCSSCHTGGGSGGVNFGTTYADTQKDSNYCGGLTVGECLSVRIIDLTMPPPGVKEGTIEQAGLDILAAWVDAGMPE
jgi:cytochrome c5